MTNREIFETDGLRCRLWVAEDLNAIFSVYSDVEGARWVDDGTPITMEESIRWLDVTFDNYERRGYGMSALVAKSSGEVVGFCGLVHPNGKDTAEIKYAFSKDCWGLGYASEIVPAMLNYGQSVHGLDKIIATVAEENKASRRVLEKSGMTYSGQYEDEGHTRLVYEWYA